MIRNPRIETYSIYTPISLLTKKFGDDFVRETDPYFFDEYGVERQFKGVCYYFCTSNTLIKIISKISLENPESDQEECSDGDKPIPSAFLDKIDWEFSLVIPRHEFPALHNIFNQISYYTNYYFSAKCKRNNRLDSLELSEEVCLTLPCETSKLIFMTWKEVGENLDFRGVLKLLGFEYSTSVKDIEDDLQDQKLLEGV